MLRLEISPSYVVGSPLIFSKAQLARKLGDRTDLYVMMRIMWRENLRLVDGPRDRGVTSR